MGSFVWVCSVYIFLKVSDSIKFWSNCFALTLHSSTFVIMVMQILWASKCEVSRLFGVHHFENPVKNCVNKHWKCPLNSNHLILSKCSVPSISAQVIDLEATFVPTTKWSASCLNSAVTFYYERSFRFPSLVTRSVVTTVHLSFTVSVLGKFFLFHTSVGDSLNSSWGMMKPWGEVLEVVM